MKRKPVVRRRKADDDIESTVAYYQAEAGSATATDLLNQLESALQSVAKQPGAGSQRFGHELDIPDLRQWPLGRFPYLIFYVEKSNRIEIVRVLHTSRNVTALITLDDTQ
ncbi:MAG TPA: type II toxin-antitoxin system RelE/ParE family toxin [Pyrinomonadaceae bacterium]|nr:type II toxin-antitoxin system RelE/ParE family toxin [Pyrinomonadaceae bacterium]